MADQKATDATPAESKKLPPGIAKDSHKPTVKQGEAFSVKGLLTRLSTR